MITRSEPKIRQAIAAHPELDDRQIGRIVGINRWSKVRLVRAAMAAEARAPQPIPVAPEWVRLSEALVRMIAREDDAQRKYELRLALLRTRYTPYMEARNATPPRPR
jgi:hypothetical protein